MGIICVLSAFDSLHGAFSSLLFFSSFVSSCHLAAKYHALTDNCTRHKQNIML